MLCRGVSTALQCPRADQCSWATSVAVAGTSYGMCTTPRWRAQRAGSQADRPWSTNSNATSTPSTVAAATPAHDDSRSFIYVLYLVMMLLMMMMFMVNLVVEKQQRPHQCGATGLDN